MPDNQGNFEIQLIDIYGRTIKNVLCYRNMQLDVSSLSKGIYTVLIRENGKNIYSQKLVKL